MITPNMHYTDLKDSYLFYNITQKTKHTLKKSRHASLPYGYRRCISAALHQAVDDKATKENFHGYMPECGAQFLCEAIAKYYVEKV